MPTKGILIREILNLPEDKFKEFVSKVMIEHYDSNCDDKRYTEIWMLAVEGKREEMIQKMIDLKIVELKKEDIPLMN